MPVASQFSGKAFRAGKETAMTVAGAGLRAILAAGERRSVAVRRYLTEELIEAAAFVR